MQLNLRLMTHPTSKKGNGNTRAYGRVSPEQYARLKAEVAAPYRGLRQFIYFAFGASGFIGGIIFLAKVAAGREVASALPNLALQIGVVALMVWLFRLEKKAERKL
jgi:hypothetical protein